MAARYKKCPPAGAPDWVMTFGDMMSLLLTFFILLLSLSEIKREDEFRAIVKEVKKAFGNKGGGGKVPTKDDPELSFIQRLVAMRMVSRTTPVKSDADDPGISGVQQRVTAVREDETQTVGGRTTFEPGSALLDAQQKRELEQLAAVIRGYNTKVLIDGHADTGEPLAGGGFRDLLDLSIARAKAVRDYLTGSRCRVRPDRIKVSGNADSEKLKWTVIGPAARRTNRRVEIQVSDRLVDEVTRPEMDTGN